MDAAREYYFTVHPAQLAASYIATDGNSLLATIIEKHFATIRAELARWKLLQSWGGTPEIVEQFIKGQQNRIHAAQDVEAELASLRNAQARAPLQAPLQTLREIEDLCVRLDLSPDSLLLRVASVARKAINQAEDAVPAPTDDAKGTPANPLPATLRAGTKYDSDGYHAARLMCKAADEIERLESALTQSREEVARYKTKADECWGAANYRLKYLVSLYVALGMKVNDENPESQRLEASEMITALRLRVAELEKAHDYVLKDNHILRQHLRSQEAVIAERDRLAATVATLQRDKADAEKDAARYQYLRNDPPSSLCVRKKSKSVIVSDLIYVDGENLDGLIDAALSTPKPEGIQPNIKT